MKLGSFLRVLRIVFAVGLIALSLWALLLPPLFPYSSHAIVNTKVAAIRAKDEGQVKNLLMDRKTMLKAGDRVASVTRDLVKVQRDLEQRQFKRLKLKEQLGSLGKAIEAQEKKRQEAEAELATRRQSVIQAMELTCKGAVEKVRIYTEEVAEKKNGQERVAPLFAEGIVTAAQWSETRKQTLEAEKNLVAAKSELVLQETTLEGLRGNAAAANTDDASLKRIDSCEQEISRMQIQKIELNAELSSVENQIASVKSYTQSDLSYDLTTPIDGIIWRRHVVNGEDLSEGENVVDVADAHSMFVEAYLQRDFVNSIAIGDRATVYLLDQSSFIYGRLADIQVQERTAKDANIINTIEMDATVLRVNIEIDPGVLKTENIGQLAKVVISSGKPGVIERGLIWLSLIFQSHK